MCYYHCVYFLSFIMSVLEVSDLQMSTPHVISDGDDDDDDDVIFITYVSPPIVDLCQNSPVAVRPAEGLRSTEGIDNRQPTATTSSARSVPLLPPSTNQFNPYHYIDSLPTMREMRERAGWSSRFNGKY